MIHNKVLRESLERFFEKAPSNGTVDGVCLWCLNSIYIGQGHQSDCAWQEVNSQIVRRAERIP